MSYSQKAFRKILYIDIVLFITLAVFSYFNSYFVIDVPITRFLQTIHQGWFDTLMRSLTFWGEPQKSLTGILLLSFILYLLRQKKDAIVCLVSGYGLVILTTAIKFIVHRERPSADLVQQLIPKLNNGSFPSYHVIAAIAIFGYLFFIIRKHIKEDIKRRILEVIFLLIIFLMGVSRVYLGVHWASDVLGSFLLGFGWIGILAKYYDKIAL